MKNTKPNDDYENILIAPILRSTTIGQVRQRARSSRKKLDRHGKVTQMSVGDALDVLDRITNAEARAAERIIRAQEGKR